MTVYEWPGNIRELENGTRKLIILRNPDGIARELQAGTARLHTSEHLQASGMGSNGSGVLKNTILAQVHHAKNDAETAPIIAALESTHSNRKKTAVLLTIDYEALLYKMDKRDIDDRMATLSVAAATSDNQQTCIAARSSGCSEG
jgi:DNA-binding NtrC family response regulator